MGVVYRIRAPQPSVSGQIRELSLDLGLDVQRGLSASGPPLVAGDHELAHLHPESGVLAVTLVVPVGVDLGIERHQAIDLRLDVEGLLAASRLAVVSGLDELPDLCLALGARDGAAGSRPGRAVLNRARLLDREVSTAELVEQPERPGEEDRGDRGDDEHDDPDDGAELQGEDPR
jgi:hypothetical protein